MVAIVALPSILAGCFPYVASYVHLHGAGVTHPRAACGQIGPPVFARYERHGVQFDVTLEPGWASRSQVGFVRLRAPHGALISIPQPTGYLLPGSGPDRNPITFVLKRAPPESPLVSEILARSGLVEQRFEFEGMPPITFPGTLTLPSVIVDGTAVTLPAFEFERRPYAGIAPLNC
jgi:hypothetical protein